MYEMNNSGKTRSETFLDRFFTLDLDCEVYFDPKERLCSVGRDLVRIAHRVCQNGHTGTTLLSMKYKLRVEVNLTLRRLVLG